MTSFLQELAQARPDPGGGAAAAFGANLGLALLEKVVKLEGRRRRKTADATGLTWEEALARLRGLAANLERLRAADVQAYFNLVAARASGDPARRAAAVEEAVDCPRQIMEQAAKALELLGWAGAHCQKHLVSDLLVAGEFLGAALKGAGHIAGANLPLVPEAHSRQALARELAQAYRQGEDLYQRVQADLMAGMRLPHWPDS